MDIYKQTIEKVLESHSPLIILSPTNDLGILTSGLVLKTILESRNQKARIVMPEIEHISSMFQKKYPFIENLKDIDNTNICLHSVVISLDTSKTKVHDFSYEIQNNQLRINLTTSGDYFSSSSINSKHIAPYDLVIIVGSSSLKDLGAFAENQRDLLNKTTIINIDNNKSNTFFGTINLIDTESPSIAEMVYNIIDSLDNNQSILDEKTATLLLTGIIYTTKNFKSQNVTSKTLQIGSKLLAAKANRQDILKNLYQNYTPELLKVWGKILVKLEYDQSKKLTWSSINQNDIWPYNIEDENIIKIIEDFIVPMKDIESVAIFYAKNNDTIQVYLQTPLITKPIEIENMQISEMYQNKHFISFSIEHSALPIAQEAVLKYLQEKI